MSFWMDGSLEGCLSSKSFGSNNFHQFEEVEKFLRRVLRKLLFIFPNAVFYAIFRARKHGGQFFVADADGCEPDHPLLFFCHFDGFFDPFSLTKCIYHVVEG